VDMSTPLFPEVVPKIDANPVSFIVTGEGGGVGGRSGLGPHLYVSFNVAVLEFERTSEDGSK